MIPFTRGSSGISVATWLVFESPASGYLVLDRRAFCPSEARTLCVKNFCADLWTTVVVHQSSVLAVKTFTVNPAWYCG